MFFDCHSRRIHPKILIKKYFEQLTSGCGLSICHNKQCVKGGHTKLPSNEAAAQALKFLKEEAQICEIIGIFLLK